MPFTLQKPRGKYKCCICFYVLEEKSAQNPTQEIMPELLFLKFPACALTTTIKKNNPTSFAYSNCTTTFFKMKPSSLPAYADSCDHFGDGPQSRIKLSTTMELHSKSWWLQMTKDLPGLNFVLSVLSRVTVLCYRLVIHLRQTLETQMWWGKIWGSSFSQHCSVQRHTPPFSYPSSSSLTLKAGLLDKLLIVNAFWPIFPTLPSSSDSIIANTLKTEERSTFYQHISKYFLRINVFILAKDLFLGKESK